MPKNKKEEQLRKTKRFQEDLTKGKFGKPKEGGALAGLSKENPPRKFKTALKVEGAQQQSMGAGDVNIQAGLSQQKKLQKEQKETGLKDTDFTRGRTEGATIGGLRREVEPGTGQRITEAIQQGATPEMVEQIISESDTGAAPTEVPEGRFANLGQQQNQGTAGSILNPQQGAKLLGFKVDKGKGLLGGDYATMRNLAVAAGWGVAIGASIIGLSAIGARLGVTRGLSSPSVSRAASGIFKKVEVLGKPIKTRIATTGSKFVTKVQIPINTRYANSVVNLLSKATNGFKFSTAVKGIVGTTIMAGFLREETLQNIGYPVRDAIQEGDYEAAAEGLALYDEVTNEEIWNIADQAGEVTGLEYVKAARLDLEVQSSKLQKALAGELQTQKKQQEDALKSEVFRTRKEEDRSRFGDVAGTKEARKAERALKQFQESK